MAEAARRRAALTGLEAEAAILRQAAEREGCPLDVTVAGMGAGVARTASARAVAASPVTLISFGFAGGLHPDLKAGELVIPETVALPDGGQVPVDTVARHRLLAAIVDPVHQGRVLAPETPLTTAAAKSSAWKNTGAAIVDLESGEVARAARAAGIPFVVVRAVSDPAWRDVPVAALRTIDSRGKLRWAGVPGLLVHPRALFLMWRDSRRAKASLRWAAAALCRSLRGEE